MIRRMYIRKAEDSLARLEVDIDRLRNRRTTPVDVVKDRIDQAIEKIRETGSGGR